MKYSIQIVVGFKSFLTILLVFHLYYQVCGLPSLYTEDLNKMSKFVKVGAREQLRYRD
jgi:hypothetical protein